MLQRFVALAWASYALGTVASAYRGEFSHRLVNPLIERSKLTSSGHFGY